MEQFINLINTKYSDKSKEEILNTLNTVKEISSDNQLYDLDFAMCVAQLAVRNKLDSKCISVALIYPFVISDKYDYNVLDAERIDIINALLTLYKIKINNKQEETKAIRSLFLSTTKDLRTMVLKLCIETAKLNYLDKISKEEQDNLIFNLTNFYAPIASMIGVSDIKDTIEDALLKYNMPEFYDELSNAVKTCVKEGQQEIDNVISKINSEFKTTIPNLKVFGRQKKVYSIAKKLIRKKMGVKDIINTYDGNLIDNYNKQIKGFSSTKLNQIVDVLAIMVLVNTIDECYSVLGKIFTIFTPLGNFKDYISHPKENGYQALHTIVLLNEKTPLEIQIRTFDMHEYNEYGLASHWAYKDKSKVDKNDLRINYMRKLMKTLQEEHNEDELLQLMTQDVYSDNIFVQTPLGKVIQLPESSNPIDFAYNIHSKIGNQCVGAKVNGKIVPLTTPLNNGDVVEIITNVNAKGPSRDWLKLVKSNSAKKKIRDFFKHEMKEDNIKRGKSMLEAQAKVRGMNLSECMTDKALEAIYDKYSLSSLDDMYSSIGYGSLTTQQVLNKLDSVSKNEDKTENYVVKTHRKYKNESTVSVKGQTDLMIKFCKHCNPLPGDAIIGFISRANGITIHRTTCHTLSHCELERLIECEWNSQENQKMIGSITIITQNKTGVISSISKKINDLDINITGISSKNNNNNTGTIYLQVEVKSREELNDLINKLNNFSFVLDIYRA